MKIIKMEIKSRQAQQLFLFTFAFIFLCIVLCFSLDDDKKNREK